jgi:hypothetical protein
MGGIISTPEIADFLTVKDRIRRIDECILPDDREPVLDFLEGLEGKLQDEKLAEERAEEFHDAQGVKILLKMMKRMSRDEVALRLIVGCFEKVRHHIPTIMDFIQYGGLEMLEKANVQHEGDDFLKIMIPNLLRAVLAVGARAAIQEISHEGLQLRLCQKCQEVIERANNPLSIGKMLKVPSSATRANRVLMFMENYPTRKDVQMKGLDALITFARNADAPKVVHETHMVVVTSDSLKQFKDDVDIVWRAALALALIAEFTSEIAYEIVSYDIHNIAAEIFESFEGNFRCQQQILWMFASLLRHLRAKRKINASEECMLLFQKLKLLREHLIKTKANSQTDKFLPYEVVSPIEIREFLRQTGGEVVPEPKWEGTKEKRKFKKRKNIDGMEPKHGTVDGHFKAGVPGLVD